MDTIAILIAAGAALTMVAVSENWHVSVTHWLGTFFRLYP